MARISELRSVSRQLGSVPPVPRPGWRAQTWTAQPGRTVILPSVLRTLAATVLAMQFTALPAQPDSARESASPDIPAIRADLPRAAPDWAVMERHLIETMDRAGVEFFNTYTLPDGSLRWKERYEGGMNSSDDAYEGFRGFSLHHVLGGSKNLDTLHRTVWEGITRQFTRYGQIYREFDSNWDWMHHGEGYVSLYPFGMADPLDARFRERSVRFAAMYTGEDPEARNYDPQLRLMRASMNGSRGPKMQWTWCSARTACSAVDEGGTRRTTLPTRRTSTGGASSWARSATASVACCAISA